MLHLPDSFSPPLHACGRKDPFSMSNPPRDASEEEACWLPGDSPLVEESSCGVLGLVEAVWVEKGPIYIYRGCL
jgi:hypothetical protein